MTPASEFQRWTDRLFLIGTVIAAAVLWFVNPLYFPLSRLAANAAAYGGVFFVFLRGASARIAREYPHPTWPSEEHRSYLKELLIFALVIGLGFLAGSIAGGVWWVSGGSGVQSLPLALLWGGAVGGSIPAALGVGAALAAGPGF